MSFYRNISIKNKITITILFISTLTMIIGFSIVGINDVKSLRKEMHLNALMNTRLIGEYSIAPLTFDDNPGAENILSKLSTIPGVISGTLYDRNGILFSSYKRSEDLFIQPLYENPDNLIESSSLFKKQFLQIDHPIIYNNYKYGIIVIKLETYILNKKIQDYIFIMAGILLGMIILSFLLANRFQKPISQPLLELSQLTRLFSSEGN